VTWGQSGGIVKSVESAGNFGFYRWQTAGEYLTGSKRGKLVTVASAVKVL